MKRRALVALACCLPLFAASCEQAPKVAEVGKPAPDFTLVDRQGKTWTLSQLRGRVGFINFWATWCPPCREEMPSMQRLFTMVPKDTFVMLAVLENDDPARADSFAARAGLTMPILVDQDKKVWPTYGLTGVPETFIVDKKGVLREKFIGPAQWDSPRNLEMLGNYLSQN
jgi:peroxiredoxin